VFIASLTAFTIAFHVSGGRTVALLKAVLNDFLNPRSIFGDFLA